MAVDTTSMKDLLMRWAEQVAGDAADTMRDALEAAAPLGETGDTRRGIQVTPTGGPDHPAFLVRSTSPHGDFVEEGTAPHLILPRNAKALRFLGGSGRISTAAPNQRTPTSGGGVVFARAVQHPGTPARPWFEPVVQQWSDFLQQAAAGVTVSG